MNEVGFCPVVSGVLSVWVFVLWGFVSVGFCPVGFCPYTQIALLIHTAHSSKDNKQTFMVTGLICTSYFLVIYFYLVLNGLPMYQIPVLPAILWNCRQ